MIYILLTGDHSLYNVVHIYLSICHLSVHLSITLFSHSYVNPFLHLSVHSLIHSSIITYRPKLSEKFIPSLNFPPTTHIINAPVTPSIFVLLN